MNVSFNVDKTKLKKGISECQPCQTFNARALKVRFTVPLFKKNSLRRIEDRGKLR